MEKSDHTDSNRPSNEKELAPEPKPSETPGISTLESQSTGKEPAAPSTPRIKNVVTEKNRETPTLVSKKKEEEVKKDQPGNQQKLSSEFTKEQLLESWTQFVNKRKKKGTGEMEQLILNRQLSKTGDQEVTMLLFSELETTILEKIEMELVSHLRKTLENDFIVLKKKVREEEAKQKLYTSSDKFDYLAEQNPKLKELKDKLGLDLEF